MGRRHYSPELTPEEANRIAFWILHSDLSIRQISKRVRKSRAQVREVAAKISIATKHAKAEKA